MSINVVCRIRPRVGAEANQPEGFTTSGNKLIFRQPEKDEIQFKTIYGESATFKEVYNGHVANLVNHFLQGYNVCLIGFGPTGSGKSYIIEGSKGTRGGLVPCIIEGIFSQLQRKTNSGGGGNGGKTSPKLYFQMCEVYNEIVSDLQNRNNRDLELEFTPQVGTQVKGLTRRDVGDANECLNYFFEGKTNRTNSMTDLGPTSQRASAFFTFELNQHVSEGGHGGRKVNYVSKFTVVDLAGAEKLADDLTALRMREGPTLNKSIVAFGQVVQTLSSPSEAEFVNYDESKTTSLMHDVLGGNTWTTVITTLKPTTDPSVGLSVARMARSLANVSNFPVPNDEYVRGLVAKYRSNVSRLKEKIEIYKTSKAGDGSDATSKLMKVHELEGQIIKDNLEKTRMREENEKIYEKLMEIRTKYNELVTQKSSISSELIESEEERLKVSKALVDLQIENSRLKETSDERNFELQNKVLSLENDVLELEMIKEKLEKNNENLNEDSEKLRSEIREISDEYVALKSNFITLTSDHEKEVAKAEELGLELLNLVNTKAALLKEKDAYTVELEKLRSQNEGLTTTLSSAEQQENERSKELTQLRADIEKVRQDMMTRQVENGQAILKLENRKLELERQVMELTKMKDGDIRELKQHHEEDIAKLEAAKEALQKENANFKREIRSADRKLAELSDEVKRLSGEKAQVVMQNAKILSKSKEHMDAYRERLQQYIKDITIFISKVKSKDDPKVQTQLQHSVDMMINEITRTYVEKEKDLGGQYEALENKHKELTARYERLLSSFRKLREEVEEFPSEFAARFKEMKDNAEDIPDSLRSESQMKKDLEYAKKAFYSIERENSELKEKMLAESEKNRNMMAEMQAQFAKAIKETQDGLDSKLAMTTDEKDRKLINQQKIIHNFQTLGIKDNKKAFTTEITRLKEENALLRKMIKGNAEGGGGTVKNATSVRREIKDFTRNKLEEIEKERSKLLVTSALAEEKAQRLQGFVDTRLSEYAAQISQLKAKLAKATKASQQQL
eukprot:Nk52_evm5s2506 gene=Nk52_evmTU5s2506